MTRHGCVSSRRYAVTSLEFLRNIVLYALAVVHIVLAVVGRPCGLTLMNIGMEGGVLHKVYRLLWNSY